MAVTIEKLQTPRCEVGEGPIWDPATNRFYFIDMKGRKFFRFDPANGTLDAWDTPSYIGSFALRKSGGAIFSLVDGLYAFDFDSGAITPFKSLPGLNDQLQLNDGKADRRGRFIVGAAHAHFSKPLGDLYSVDTDGSVKVLDKGFCVSNGPCWAPDDKTFYFADSMKGEIYAYEYDIETGDVGERRLFAATQDLGGFPDGATVDADGLLWSAIPGGGVIAVYRPNGKLERTVEVPSKNPASVTFGGENHDRLFVVTLDTSHFQPTPQADMDGYTFVIDGLGVKGLPEPYYAG